MRLPSMTALRAFEAAARHRSLSAAGRELNVTHAAVAQQVRALEADLGLPLAFRDGRGLALTEEGERLADGLGRGFATITAAVQDLRDTDRARPLRVTITPSFAAQWLMPRLGRFWAEHPDIALSLHPEQRVVDLTTEHMDLAIRFGAGKWPGTDSELLTPAFYTIVGAPSLIGDRETLTPAEMAALPWVLEESWPEQHVWLRSLGIDTAKLDVTEVPTEELALSAARQGYGLHVEVSALLDDDIASGRLKIVYRSRFEDGTSYWLVTRPGPKKPALKTLMRWLKSAV
ncbi:MAG: LysR family transcriptional regulator [Rhodobacteraceae bacterium]|jgi:LysR family glycine cleavage system transcriptional activator|nr:LysR family transcriptional regulator [Paracoccaceae bacterium]